MEKQKTLTSLSILLIILGLVMIYLGAFAGQKLILPPFISGIGFLAIAWGFLALRK